MFIFAANLALMFIWYLILMRNENIKNGKKIYCSIVAIQWILIMGLRDQTIGSDTPQYARIYVDALQHTWGQSLEQFINAYFSFDTFNPFAEAGFDLFFMKPVQILGGNFQVFLFLETVFFIVLLTRFIYKYSDDAFISFFVFGGMLCQYMTGIMQSLAIALVVFIGFSFIVKRRLLPFIALVLFATTIHKSAWLFLPMYFLFKKEITKGYLTGVVIALPVLFLIQGFFADALFTWVGYEGYALSDHVGDNAAIYAALFLLMFLIVLWRRRAILDVSALASSGIHAIIAICLILPFTFSNSNALRVGFYYMFLLPLLFPDVIRSFPRKEQSVVLGIFVIIMSAISLLVISPRLWSGYYFFFME
jgi:transmembrane protein EpsG